MGTTDWMDAYLDAWNSRDGSQVTAYMTQDATYEDLALGVLHEGVDAIKVFVEEAGAFSSDYRFTPVSQQQSGSSYCLEWEMAGTHTGEGGGLPATNKPYLIRGVSVGQLDGNGKIRQNRDYWNMADYLMQVGLIPPPDAG